MEQRGPWKIKSSEVGYKDSRVEVRKDKVLDVGGKEYSLRTITIRDGASILPLDDQGNVYLIKKFHYGFGEITLEASAGGIDAGEEPLAAAKRELQEETGISGAQWIDLGRAAALTSYMHHIEHLYLVRDLTFADPTLDAGELITVQKMPLAEAIDLVMQSVIVDAYTATLILKAAKYLGKL